MNIIKDLTPINHAKGRSQNIRGVVIHSMDGFYNGTISWFKNPDAQVSAHYLISKSGEVRQMVEDKDTAWHAGNYNPYTIGIELEDERKRQEYIYPQAQINALKELLKELRGKYGNLEILLHKEIQSNRSDPVGNFDRSWISGTPAGGDEKITIPVKERDFLVSRATTAKEVAEYLQLVNPDTAPTSEYKNTIGGFKSRSTELQGKLNTEVEEHARTKTELSNRVEQVGRLKEDVTKYQKIEETLTNELKKAGQQSSDSIRVYQGMLKEAEEKIKTLATEKGNALNEVAEWKAKYETLLKTGKDTRTLLEVIIDFLSNIKVVK